MTWTHLSDSLSWSPGHMGKGYITYDGTIKTWNVDTFEPRDQADVRQLNGDQAAMLHFEVDPDGGIVTDEPSSKVKLITDADDRLYDAGQRPVFEDDWNLDNFTEKPVQTGSPDYNFILSSESPWDFDYADVGAPDPNQWPQANQWRVNIGTYPSGYIRDWMLQHHPETPMQAVQAQGGWRGPDAEGVVRDYPELSTGLHLYDTPTPRAQQIVDHFGQAHPHEDAFGVQAQGHESQLYTNPYSQRVPEQGSWDFYDQPGQLPLPASTTWERRPLSARERSSLGMSAPEVLGLGAWSAAIGLLPGDDRGEVGASPGLKQEPLAAGHDEHYSAELHVGLAIPEPIRKRIRAWVDDQDWPEGTALEDPSDYHITLMYAPDGHEEHKDADWMDHTDGVNVRVTDVDEFGEDDDDERAIVLRIDSPKAKALADDMQAQAEDHALEISTFPGGYKPHITVAYGPGKPEGPALSLSFRTGPSSVSPLREGSVTPIRNTRYQALGRYDHVIGGQTRNQRIQWAQAHDEKYGPDQSLVQHQFPDGWSIREPYTYGDLHREGSLMSNCWKAPDPERPNDPVHEIWNEPNQDDYGHPLPQNDPNRITPDFDWEIPNADTERFLSLRDPDNVPHLSFNHLPENGMLSNVLGTHNSTPRYPYVQYLQQWQAHPTEPYDKVDTYQDYGEGHPDAWPSTPIADWFQHHDDWENKTGPFEYMAPQQTTAAVDDHHILAPAVELKEWLADFGAQDPPSIHHDSEQDFIQAPPVSTADDLPYYPPAEVPKELKQSSWEELTTEVETWHRDRNLASAMIKEAAKDRGSVDINAGWQSPYADTPHSYDPQASDPYGLAPLQDLAQSLHTGWADSMGADARGRPEGYQSPEDVSDEWVKYQAADPQGALRIKQAVANVIVAACLSPKTSLEANAQQYQDAIKSVPWDCTDPNVYWNALEKARQDWNVERGHPDDIHRPWNVVNKTASKDPLTGKKIYTQEPPYFKQFLGVLRQENPRLSPEELEKEGNRMVREWKLMFEHKFNERNAELPPEQVHEGHLVDNESNKGVMTILKAVISGVAPVQAAQEALQAVAAFDYSGPEYKDTANEKMFNQYKYPAFMGTALQAICQLKQHLDDLIEAALVDVHARDGKGYHFRAQVLSYNVSGIGPKLASFMWLLLQPLTSQLGTIDTHMANVLGHKIPGSEGIPNRDFFQAERELQTYRDLMGMKNVPLGLFQWLIWDLQRSGQNGAAGLPLHQDHAPLRPLDPRPASETPWLPKLHQPEQNPVFEPYQEQVQPVSNDYRENVLGADPHNPAGRLQWAKNAVPTQMEWPV